MLLDVVCLLLCYITLSDSMDGGVAMYELCFFFPCFMDGGVARFEFIH